MNINKGYSQDEKMLRKYEDSLTSLSLIVSLSKDYVEKENANNLLLNYFETVLEMKNSFNYPFDSLKTISLQRSPDNLCRIITWQLTASDGSCKHFGFVQLNPKKFNDTLMFRLYDRTDSIAHADIADLDRFHWYGAIYYKLIQETTKDKTYYTLLGWNSNNQLSNKKIIDVLTVSEDGKILFGSDIFQGYNKKKKMKRILFEYAKNSTMSLKYQQQNKSLNNQKSWMIVFDRLIPLSQNLEGVYCYYVPATNIFDAFIFDKGKWNFVKDIDARNQPTKIKKRKPEMGIVPKK